MTPITDRILALSRLLGLRAKREGLVAYPNNRFTCVAQKWNVGGQVFYTFIRIIHRPQKRHRGFLWRAYRMTVIGPVGFRKTFSSVAFHPRESGKFYESEEGASTEGGCSVVFGLPDAVPTEDDARVSVFDALRSVLRRKVFPTASGNWFSPDGDHLVLLPPGSQQGGCSGTPWTPTALGEANDLTDTVGSIKPCGAWHAPIVGRLM